MIILISLFVLIIIAIIIFLSYVISYYHYIKNYLKLSYKQWISIYPTAPEKWEVSDGGWYCHLVYKTTVSYKTVYMSNYLDYLRLCFFKRYENKQELKMDQIKQDADFIKYLENDLADYHKKLNDEMKEKLDED